MKWEQTFVVLNNLTRLEKYITAEQRSALKEMTYRNDLDSQDIETLIETIKTLIKTLSFDARVQSANTLCKIIEKYAQS